LTGVLGGTFDPVHRGHIHAAEQLLKGAALEEVWLMPNAHPPHRPVEPDASPPERLKMLELAVAGRPGLMVSDLEVRRGGPSFTIDTLEELRRTYPEKSFAWLLGSDQAREIRSWQRAADLLASGRFIVFNRPSAEIDPTDLARLGFSPQRTSFVQIQPLPIAAHEVRVRLARGLPVSDMLPDQVSEYIRSHGLYRSEKRMG
jgi:nicotinate-nucleotide adenylyltransferase